MKILVVDDMASMRKVTSHILKQLGYTNIFLADGGSSAIGKLKHGDYDFVITDWNMPGVSGLDLLKHIRKTERLAKIPVLMITTEGSRAQVLDAAKAGVNSYIMKPFSPAMLKEKISKIFDDVKKPATKPKAKQPAAIK
jgi:two-component system chemotaxis response regulator CheY